MGGLACNGAVIRAGPAQHAHAIHLKLAALVLQVVVHSTIHKHFRPDYFRPFLAHMQTALPQS